MTAVGTGVKHASRNAATNNRRPAYPQFLLCHGDYGIEHQRADDDPNARQSMKDDRKMDEVLQDGCHQADDDNGGGDNAQGSGYAAQESGLLVAHIGGGIDGDNAGRALSNRVTYPAVPRRATIFGLPRPPSGAWEAWRALLRT